eukprot:IDg17882t1
MDRNADLISDPWALELVRISLIEFQEETTQKVSQMRVVREFRADYSPDLPSFIWGYSKKTPIGIHCHASSASERPLKKLPSQ